MKKISSFFCLALLGVALSCQDSVEVSQSIPQDIITKLNAAGFDTSEGLSAYKGGYLVEYDIFLTADKINALSGAKNISPAAATEQYRTTNLVTGTPRTLKIYMDPGFESYMQNSFNSALARYNAENLVLSFVRTTSTADADIQILSFYENSSTLGFSAGFPSASGNPASPIKLNTKYYSNASPRADAVTVIAHEIGHAIGFRHTDYMSRRYSCGSGGNEGTAGVGAIWIPGTPKKGEAGSYMLACSNGTDRPFTSGDKTALSTVY